MYLHFIGAISFVKVKFWTIEGVVQLFYHHETDTLPNRAINPFFHRLTWILSWAISSSLEDRSTTMALIVSTSMIVDFTVNERITKSETSRCHNGRKIIPSCFSIRSLISSRISRSEPSISSSLQNNHMVRKTDSFGSFQNNTSRERSAKPR